MTEKAHVWMTDEEYQLVTEKTPIPTVDMVILRKTNSGWKTLLLKRKTGYEKGKWCIIGGRVWKGETLGEAIRRHSQDLGVEVSVISPFAPDFPAWINDNRLQDKTKHSITHVYPVLITKGKVRKEGEEYSGYAWFSPDQLPEMAYDHRTEVEKALDQLKKFKHE